jgi:enediyne biosynthesis protein E4
MAKQACALNRDFRMKLFRVVLALFTGFLVSASAAPCPIQLRDITARTGIKFVHNDGHGGQRYLIETVSSGVATFDYDLDGLIDIYFANGAPLKNGTNNTPTHDALYRNNGDGTFTEVTEFAGVGDTSFTLGVTIGDYDNDGAPDIYLNNFGPNVLYHNNGDGTFTDVAAKAGVIVGAHVGAGANFVDIDGDGHLDLFVANYVQFTYENHKPVAIRGFPAYPGPKDYPLCPDTMFRNNGDGTFTDISKDSGIAAHPGLGMGSVCADYDQDGRPDIMVANDEGPNYVFHNLGKGKFEESGLLSGFAFDANGQVHGNMGVECGDYNNDGLPDFYVTSYSKELAVLYQNTGHGLLEDVTVKTGAGEGTLAPVTWGSGLVDFDNDGFRDLYVACGHLQDNVELWDDSTTYLARNVCLRNLCNGKFANVTDVCGDGLAVKLSSRGIACDDLDNDGKVDVVVLNSRREPTILHNESATGAHWIQIHLRGTQSNRDAVGARVTVKAGDLTQTAEVHSGRAYQSHFGTRLQFGLGSRTRVDAIEVHWPGGGSQTFNALPIDCLFRLTQSKAN